MKNEEYVTTKNNHVLIDATFVNIFSEEISSNRLDGGSRYSILDNGTLTIRNTQDSDKGSYECVARNPMGEAKASPVELRQFDNSLPSKFLFESFVE